MPSRRRRRRELRRAPERRPNAGERRKSATGHQIARSWARSIEDRAPHPAGPTRRHGDGRSVAGDDQRRQRLRVVCGRTPTGRFRAIYVARRGKTSARNTLSQAEELEQQRFEPNAGNGGRRRSGPNGATATARQRQPQRERSTGEAHRAAKEGPRRVSSRRGARGRRNRAVAGVGDGFDFADAELHSANGGLQGE